jgi:hypothetical protein
MYLPGVGDNGDAKLGREEEHAQDLVHAGETECVELESVESFGLEQLLEHDPVVDVLARSDADAVGLERLADLGVTEDVVGRGGLLDEAESSRQVRSVAEGSRAGSTHKRLKSASLGMYSIASSTSHSWLTSVYTASA